MTDDLPTASEIKAAAQTSPAILVVEDSEATAALYEEYLRSADYRVKLAGTVAVALGLLGSERFDAVVLDLNLPDGNGLSILKEIRRQGLPVETLVVTATGTLAVAVEAMREGAFDFIVKPFARDRLLVTMRNAMERRRLRAAVDTYESEFGRNRYFGFVGASLAMQRVYRIVDSAAPSQAPIYVSGESGTGKEVCADAIHRRSPRAAGPFVAVSCAALPRESIESELFGHRKGAFPGASEDKKGALVRANGGTIFIEEIGDMDAGLQSKLLRFMETGVVEPMGGGPGEAVDVRIVCSSTREARHELKAGRLREDLFFRLHVIPVQLPPVREREDDAVLLARHALQRFAKDEGKAFRDIEAEAEYALRTYPWPGNVREIENVMRSVVVLHEGEMVRLDMLPRHVAEATRGAGMPSIVKPSAAPAEPAPAPGEGKPKIRPLWISEREIIEAAIASCDGNIPRAAAFLEISPSTIYRKKQAWESLDRGA
ncbi:MAG: sigma-54-dependent Fis family transcriptional regulator [Rhodospirillales bacterium]|nr:sigma-54-dependent Fis family transcriptional regulator [Rhodospirillales bacterium]